MVVARKPLRTPWQALCDGDHDRLPAHLDRLESWLPDLTALREPDGGSTPLWADPAVLGAKTLVLAPHPDDETIGAGGTITLSTAMGRSVDVAFLTDGRSSKALLKSESSEIRRREAVQACSRLGATPHFFAIPEGSPRHERRGANDALSRLITRLDPSSILVTGPDEKHPEHRWATSLLKRVLLENGWTGKVGFYEVWASIRPTHLVDITDVFEHKKSVIEEYDCALRTVDYVQLAFLLGVHRASGGGRPGRIAEALQMMTADDYRALKEAS